MAVFCLHEPIGGGSTICPWTYTLNDKGGYQQVLSDTKRCGAEVGGRDEGCILTWNVHTYTCIYSHTHPTTCHPQSNMEMRHWYKPSLRSLWRWCFVWFLKGLGLCGLCYYVWKMFGGRGRDSKKDKHFFGGGQSVAALDEVLWWRDSVLSDICDTEGQ